MHGESSFYCIIAVSPITTANLNFVVGGSNFEHVQIHISIATIAIQSLMTTVHSYQQCIKSAGVHEPLISYKYLYALLDIRLYVSFGR